MIHRSGRLWAAMPEPGTSAQPIAATSISLRVMARVYTIPPMRRRDAPC